MDVFCRLVVLGRDFTGAANGTIVRIDAIAKRCNAVKSVGSRVRNCFLRPGLRSRFRQVPDAGIFYPWIGVCDTYAVCDIVAHVELGSLRHFRQFDPGKRFAVVYPRVIFRSKSGSVLGEECQIVTVGSRARIVLRRHVGVVEAGNSRFRHANQHGKVRERRFPGVAVNGQLDPMCEIAHRQAIGRDGIRGPHLWHGKTKRNCKYL